MGPHAYVLRPHALGEAAVIRDRRARGKPAQTKTPRTFIRGVFVCRVPSSGAAAGCTCARFRTTSRCRSAIERIPGRLHRRANAMQQVEPIPGGWRRASNQRCSVSKAGVFIRPCRLPARRFPDRSRTRRQHPHKGSNTDYFIVQTVVLRQRLC
ncbi:hypothetical protein GD429_32625 [Burkholderia sp. BE17]|nr:hypothetical protein [Burkholderia sp. BE17]